MASIPFFFNSSTVSSICFLFRLETTTLHPSSPKRVTIAFPIPVDEAVTIATRSLSDDMIVNTNKICNLHFSNRHIICIKMGCRQDKQIQQQDPLPLINMLIVGLTGSGKSTILNQLKGEPEATCNTELGIDSFIVNKKVKIIAFEVAGRASNSWHNYYITSNIVLFVIDSNKPESFERIREILKEMDEQLIEKAEIITVFNKIDLLMNDPSSTPVDEQTSHVTQHLDQNMIKVKELDKFSLPTLRHKTIALKCSGKDRIGINNLIRKIYEVAFLQGYGYQWQPQTKK